MVVGAQQSFPLSPQVSERQPIGGLGGFHETLVEKVVCCIQSRFVGVSDIDIVTGFVAKFSLNE